MKIVPFRFLPIFHADAGGDPGDHHLFVSIGCATGNWYRRHRPMGAGNAIFAFILRGQLRFWLGLTKAVVSALFNAIPERQSTRGEYDGKPISLNELAMLERVGTGNGVQVVLLPERAAMERVLEYVIQGNTAQMDDRAFVDELKAWIRFSGSDAVRTGDGLYSGSSGNPSVPSWLGSLLFGLFFTPKGENDKYAKHVRSSSGIAVFVSENESPAQWIEVGRCYERFALQSTALGMLNASSIPGRGHRAEAQFATFMGFGGRRPDLVVRFGRGPKLSPSLRRPIEAVLT